jgi:hypothetical protein
MAAPVFERYLDHLSDTDLALLGPAVGVAADPDPSDAAALLRANPDLIEPALHASLTFERLFAPGHSHPLEAWAQVSPFLLFAVAVHRGHADLAASSFVAEPFAGHRRIPVFDTALLREHFDDPERRLFAIEHLASYTRVASGPVWVRSSHDGRTRRVRFSELDPVRLAGLVDLVEDEDLPGIYRRLGDLALFLTGVFPDHAARTPAHPIAVERLARSVRAVGEGFRPEEIAPLAGANGLGGLLRVLGPRWYRLAAQKTPLTPVRRMLDDAAEGFDTARRFLTMLTDRYLFPLRDGWFGSPA